MDFSQFSTVEKAEQGAWMTIALPDGTETDAALRLAGCDSQVYKRTRNALMNKRRGVDASAELITEDYRKLISACVLELKNITVKGAAVTPETVGQFFNSFAYVYEQADKFIHDRKSYLVEGTEKKSESGVDGSSASSSVATETGTTTASAI